MSVLLALGFASALIDSHSVMGRLLSRYIGQMSSHSIANGSRASSQEVRRSFSGPPTAGSDVSMSDAVAGGGVLMINTNVPFRVARSGDVVIAILSRKRKRMTTASWFCHARTPGIWRPATLFEPQTPSPYSQQMPRRSRSHPSSFPSLVEAQ